MAVMQIFQNKTSDIVLVPWAKHPTGNGPAVASGNIISLTAEDFLTKGAAVVSDLLLQYETRDGRLPSELYETFSAAKRRKFLSQHKMLLIIHASTSLIAQIDFGGTISERIDVRWPLDEAFPVQVIRTFDVMA